MCLPHMTIVNFNAILYKLGFNLFWVWEIKICREINLYLPPFTTYGLLKKGVFSSLALVLGENGGYKDVHLEG